MTAYLSFEDWEQSFKESERYKTLQAKYTYLYPDVCDAGLSLSVRKKDNESTKMLGENSYREALIETSRFFYGYLYYLDYVFENQPNLVAEIGPSLKGLESTLLYNNYTSYNIVLDYGYATRYQDKFDAAVSLTQRPRYSLTELGDSINRFGSILKPNGRGFFSVNLARILEVTNVNDVFGKDNPTLVELEDFAKEELKKVTYTTIVSEVLITERHKKFYDMLSDDRWPSYDKFITNDIDITQLDKEIQHTINQFRNYDFANDAINGNIRIILEK